MHRIGDGVDHKVPEEQVDGVLPRKPVAVARANKQTNKHKQQVWQGEPSPGAAVGRDGPQSVHRPAGVGPVPVQTWAGVGPDLFACLPSSSSRER